MTMNVVAVAEANFINFLSLLMEFDLMPEWIPFMEKGETLKELTERRRLVRVSVGLPWPLAGRELFSEGTIFFIEDENAILFSLKSPAKDVWFGKKIKRDPKKVELVYNKAFMFIKPLSSKKTLFKFIVNGDP